MIRILDCKNPNYLSRLKLILNKRRFKSKINTDIVIKIVKDIKVYITKEATNGLCNINKDYQNIIN